MGGLDCWAYRQGGMGNLTEAKPVLTPVRGRQGWCSAPLGAEDGCVSKRPETRRLAQLFSPVNCVVEHMEEGMNGAQFQEPLSWKVRALMPLRREKQGAIKKIPGWIKPMH